MRITVLLEIETGDLAITPAGVFHKVQDAVEPEMESAGMKLVSGKASVAGVLHHWLPPQDEIKEKQQ